MNPNYLLIKRVDAKRTPSYSSDVHFLGIINVIVGSMMLISYRKDTEPLYHSFMFSLVSLYPLPAMHSLLVTSDARTSYWASYSSSALFASNYKKANLSRRQISRWDPDSLIFALKSE